MGRGFSAAESASHTAIFYGGDASIGPRLFSRGKHHDARDYLHDRAASIGPRLFSRGKANWMLPAPTFWGLQLGRGFSAAESITGLPGPSGTVHASIGPRLFSRGKLQCSRKLRRKMDGFNWAAAFQPRKAAPSYAPWRATPCFNWAAAFQPRKGYSVPNWAPTRFGLQLGRGFSAAERPGGSGGNVLIVALQLGRGFSAAERWWPCGCC